MAERMRCTAWARRPGMEFPSQLFINALIAGILLGGFYAAVTVGISISFGILDIVNIAHPAFIILGSYIAYIINQRLGIDPILTAILVLPAFYSLGVAGLSGLLLVVREARPGSVARARLLLRPALRHRSDADPGLRRRLSLRAGRLYRHARCVSAFFDLPMRMVVPFVISMLLMLSDCRFFSPRPSPAAPSWRWRRISSPCR